MCIYNYVYRNYISIRRVKMEVYFDNSSTTKSLKEVRDEVYYAMDEFWGNPSSLH